MYEAVRQEDVNLVLANIMFIYSNGSAPALDHSGASTLQLRHRHTHPAPPAVSHRMPGYLLPWRPP